MPKVILWHHLKLSGWEDSNFRPLAPHASALANCATPRNFCKDTTFFDMKVIFGEIFFIQILKSYDY